MKTEQFMNIDTSDFVFVVKEMLSEVLNNKDFMATYYNKEEIIKINKGNDALAKEMQWILKN